MKTQSQFVSPLTFPGVCQLIRRTDAIQEKSLENCALSLPTEDSALRNVPWHARYFDDALCEIVVPVPAMPEEEGIGEGGGGGTSKILKKKSHNGYCTQTRDL